MAAATGPSASVGLYLHIPFCKSKCTYCDFPSYAGLEALFETYARALLQEIDRLGPVRARSVYLGGGTPTVLPLSSLAPIVEAARGRLIADDGAEFTVEANPGTVDAGILRNLRALGVNRLSLGVQSFHEDELRLLGLIHDAGQAVDAFRAAGKAGFGNVSLDLIYGLPCQSCTAWQESLERALALQPQHLSLYALSIEENTPLAQAIEGGAVPLPDPDLAADMYELAEEQLAAAGYLHYEISNWAREPQFRCQHNLIYWRNEPYLGLGAAAHSWAGRRRWVNVARPGDYIDRLHRGEPPLAAAEEIELTLEMGETMMMGLRLLQEGVSSERFRRRFGVELDGQFGTELAELSALGLLVVDAERVRLSRQGRLLGNQVFMRFLPDLPTPGTDRPDRPVRDRDSARTL
jgi:oxygen-independent coproporphyrinogen-3 oxidase